MSLLMDALKKAEEEKKQAAKRLQEVEMEAQDTTDEDNNSRDDQVAEETPIPELLKDTAQFSLEQLDLEETTEASENEKDPHDNVDDKQWGVETVDATEAFSEDLTLENKISEGVSFNETFEETQKVVDLNDTTIIEGLSTESASAPFDDTFNGVIFESDEQETEIYEETLLGVPADQLVKDLGGGKYQPTPAAAKTVFSTHRPNKKQSSFKWGIFIVLALLAVGSFAIFYYFTITPVSRTLPSPLIARGIEKRSVESVQVDPIQMTLDSAEAEIVSENVTSSVEAEPVAEASSPSSESIELPSEVDTYVNEYEPIDEQVSEQIEITEAEGIVELVDKEIDGIISVDEASQSAIEEVENNEAMILNDPVSDEISAEAPPETLINNTQADISLISISKTKKQEKKNVMVSQAYKAYQDGYYDAAKSIYEDVLKDDPDNRDAHLGLGAIAISNKNRKSAYSHYVHLLEINPLDSLAMNALIGLSNSPDPVKDETAIKLLIKREGNIPYLYFSLGNIYAKQQRWSDAQQAFFYAYRLDTANPDYVVNLAISLDQIGQFDTALDFYKTAVELSQSTNAKFDSVVVNNRILILSKLVESKL